MIRAVFSWNSWNPSQEILQTVSIWIIQEMGVAQTIPGTMEEDNLRFRIGWVPAESDD